MMAKKRGYNWNELGAFSLDLKKNSLVRER